MTEYETCETCETCEHCVTRPAAAVWALALGSLECGQPVLLKLCTRHRDLVRAAQGRQGLGARYDALVLRDTCPARHLVDAIAEVRLTREEADAE